MVESDGGEVGGVGGIDEDNLKLIMMVTATMIG